MTTEELLKELSEVGLGVMASDHMSEVKRANVCSMVIKALSAEVEVSAEDRKYAGYWRDALKRRWNVEPHPEGIQVCFNDHEKHEACRYEVHVPVGKLRAAEAERDALRAEVEALTRERNEWRAAAEDMMGIQAKGSKRLTPEERESLAAFVSSGGKAALAQAGSALTCASCDNREPKDGFCSVWSKFVDPSHGKQCTAHSIIAKPAAQNGGEKS